MECHNDVSPEFSPSETSPASSAFFHRRDTPALWSLLSSSSGPTLKGPWLSFLQASGLDARLQRGPHVGRLERENHLPHFVDQLSLRQSRVQFFLQNTSTCCWFMLSFLSARIPMSFSTWLLSVSSSASVYTYLQLVCPNCNTLYLAMLNFIRFNH